MDAVIRHLNSIPAPEMEELKKELVEIGRISINDVLLSLVSKRGPGGKQ